MPDSAVENNGQSTDTLARVPEAVPAQAATAWSELAHHPTAPPQDFDPTTLDELPPPARRLLDRALPRRTPLGTALRLDMAGRVRVDGRWYPFVGEEIVRAGIGYVWRPVPGPVTGPDPGASAATRLSRADVLAPRQSQHERRLPGLVPIVRRRPEPVGRRAAERLACETVAWLPQALAPQAGAQWHEIDTERAVVTLAAAGRRVDVEVTVDPEGRLRSLALHRYHAANEVGTHYVGGEVERELVTDHGITIAGAGTAGWWRGSGEDEPYQLVQYAISSTQIP